jgi:hypothetical protein
MPTDCGMMFTFEQELSSVSFGAIPLKDQHHAQYLHRIRR